MADTTTKGTKGKGKEVKAKAEAKEAPAALTIEGMATYCKRRGFVYQNSEIYGGLAGFFDYGPLGSELKKNIKDSWWTAFVHQREDVVGIDGSIVAHPKVWEASGHVGGFVDLVLECTGCDTKHRADIFVSEAIDKQTDGMSKEQLFALIKQHDLKCTKCGADVKEPREFNLMFTTHIGPVVDETSVAYLRPETAQLMFADFRLVQENARLKLPFGIAQMGRAFRNEISPRNFLFRCREFEQMEIEYFIHPDDMMNCPYVDELKDYEMLVFSSEMQQENKDMQGMKLSAALKKGIIKTPWHGYWLAFIHKWFCDLGVKPESLRLRQHLPDELSHYAVDTWDVEYNYPFGWKELFGIANRGDFDLQQHMKHSGKKLEIYDQEKGESIVPHVIAEPSLGVDRSFLTFLFDAYEDDKERGNIVLHLNPRLAPVKVAVFPLLANKPELVKLAREIFKELQGMMACQYDRSGSIGRRYARQDEIGTPYCITVDFDSLEKKDVTIRDRDTTEQVRVPIEMLSHTMHKLILGRMSFKDVKKAVK